MIHGRPVYVFSQVRCALFAALSSVLVVVPVPVPVPGHARARRSHAGLHGDGWQPVRRARAEDREGDGPGGDGRLPGHRTQRLGRRAHSGGRRVTRRLRRHFPRAFASPSNSDSDSDRLRSTPLN